jgi:hypothetical protein
MYLKFIRHVIFVGSKSSELHGFEITMKGSRWGGINKAWLQTMPWNHKFNRVNRLLLRQYKGV